MRRLVLTTLLTLAACSRPNPGFEVVEPHAGTSGGEASTSLPGTTTQEVPTSDASTSGVDPTTSGETSSSSSGQEPDSTSMIGEASSSGQESTGGEIFWPTECDSPVETRAGLAAADAFLLDAPNAGSYCLDNMMWPGQCKDQDLSGVATFGSFLDIDGGLASLFIARFDPPAPIYMNKYPVPKEAFLKVVVSVRVTRASVPQGPWEPTHFKAFRVPKGKPNDGEAEPWVEGGPGTLVACEDPSPSFRCQRCNEGEFPCNATWDTDDQTPFVPGAPALPDAVVVEEDPGAGGVDVRFEFDASEAWEWLLQDGILVAPISPVAPKRVDIRAREFGNGSAGPFLSVIHCEPENI